MPHPHVYGYSFIPKKLELELESCKEYHDSNGECLICRMLSEERDFKKRVIFENEDFTVVLPFFTEYPYGVYIINRNHKQNIAQFNEREKDNLAKTIRQTVGMLDSLFETSHMMCMHQDPVNSVIILTFIISI